MVIETTSDSSKVRTNTCQSRKAALLDRSPAGGCNQPLLARSANPPKCAATPCDSRGAPSGAACSATVFDCAADTRCHRLSGVMAASPGASPAAHVRCRMGTSIAGSTGLNRWTGQNGDATPGEKYRITIRCESCPAIKG